MLQYPIQTPATARHADSIQKVTMNIVPTALGYVGLMSGKKVLQSTTSGVTIGPADPALQGAPFQGGA